MMSMQTNDEELRKIDFSDIPEMTDAQLSQLQPSHVRNQAKPMHRELPRSLGREIGSTEGND
ncbi:MAG TPA: hypothetical protein DIC57_01625 [Sphaerochaeta sp.]|jgi:hypothetical protein|nr:hypothetical protein [Sphaerochaeta sp.]HPE93169.1 hypothetical protein [Sphaerochaeta sp.]